MGETALISLVVIGRCEPRVALLRDGLQPRRGYCAVAVPCRSLESQLVPPRYCRRRLAGLLRDFRVGESTRSILSFGPPYGEPDLTLTVGGVK